MEHCRLGDVPIFKGVKLSKDECARNDVENTFMENIPYTSVAASLMYAQVCTRPYLSCWGLLLKCMS